MGLFGLIGSAVSTVGNVISHIGKTIGSEAVTNFGKSVSGFGETIGNIGQSEQGGGSGDGSSDSASEDSSQGHSGRRRNTQPEPELPPDIEEKWADLRNEFQEDVQDFVTMLREAGQDDHALEVARRIALEGIPPLMPPLVYLARFAWHGWDEEADAAALAVVMAAMASRDSREEPEEEIQSDSATGGFDLGAFAREQAIGAMVGFNNTVADAYELKNTFDFYARGFIGLNELAFPVAVFGILEGISDPSNRRAEDMATLLEAEETWFREMGIRFVSEPHDWAYTLNDWRQGNYNHLDWLGFLPIIPALNSFRKAHIDDLEIVEAAVDVDLHRTNLIATLSPTSLEQVNSIPRITTLPDGSRLFYRGQGEATDEILSIVSQQDGVSASERLYNTMIANGYTPEDIAHMTAAGLHGNDPLASIIDEDILLPQFRAPLAINPSLGNVGIPTTFNPGVAANFVGDDGVIYVIRYPGGNNVQPLTFRPAQVFANAPSQLYMEPQLYNLANQLAEEEWVFFNHIPDEYIIGSIDPSSVPILKIDAGSGNLIKTSGK